MSEARSTFEDITNEYNDIPHVAAAAVRNSRGAHHALYQAEQVAATPQLPGPRLSDAERWRYESHCISMRLTLDLVLGLSRVDKNSILDSARMLPPNEADNVISMCRDIGSRVPMVPILVVELIQHGKSWKSLKTHFLQLVGQDHAPDILATYVRQLIVSDSSRYTAIISTGQRRRNVQRALSQLSSVQCDWFADALSVVPRNDQAQRLQHCKSILRELSPLYIASLDEQDIQGLATDPIATRTSALQWLILSTVRSSQTPSSGSHNHTAINGSPQSDHHVGASSQTITTGHRRYVNVNGPISSRDDFDFQLVSPMQSVRAPQQRAVAVTRPGATPNRLRLPLPRTAPEEEERFDEDPPESLVDEYITYQLINEAMITPMATPLIARPLNRKSNAVESVQLPGDHSQERICGLIAHCRNK